MYTPDNIIRIIAGRFLQQGTPVTVEHLLLDSRRVIFPESSLFFALKSARRNGHHFLPDLYRKGCRLFVVSEAVDVSLYPEATIIEVHHTLDALQVLAAFHRSRFSYPVIGITGSNGKTIVKEWLNQLLEDQYHIVRSPRSYNSQIGVPLSVWQMNEHHQLAIFEAGISLPGEMEHLESIIQPDFGILTHIGEAHDEGFPDLDMKIMEKLRLFRDARSIILNKDDKRVAEVINKLAISGWAPPHLFTWGYDAGSDFRITDTVKDNNTLRITGLYQERELSVQLPFTDQASVENAMACLCMLLLLKVPEERICDRFLTLSRIAMRLELKKGIYQCSVINDSYNADFGSLRIALEFLVQQQPAKKTVILSDIPQHGSDPEKLYQSVAAELEEHSIDKLIGIGPELSSFSSKFEAVPGMRTEFYPDTERFLQAFRAESFSQEAILLKGGRSFRFEEIDQLLEQKVHQTVLDISLSALTHNLHEYQRLLKPETKLMAMVKAFSYGSGSVEIAAQLQFHKVDYLTVAYADEGVELRKGGITLPIMVMNPEPATFEAILQYDLEPDIYSFQLMDQLEAFMKKQGVVAYPVHIEFETGMNRLGFPLSDAGMLADRLEHSRIFSVKSVFSHLVASEEVGQDEFTQRQAAQLTAAVALLRTRIPYPFLVHVSNTAGISRHGDLQLDMVRLGVGLYGVDITQNKALSLLPVSTLKSTIAQLKYLSPGDTVSYGRRGVIDKDSTIATVRIGYADGYPRRLGNGNGKMWVNGQLAPTVGSICMDMTMIDVTGIPGLKEGGEVIVFGKELPVEQVATWAETIPYEILTGVSQRVKRIYYEE